MFPLDQGSKEIPVGADDCLGGLTFVFTGELSSIDRDSAIALAKRNGARVTGAPSSKTSFVVVGENAGPSKVDKIKKLGVKTLDEDGFFDLIRNRCGPSECSLCACTHSLTACLTTPENPTRETKSTSRSKLSNTKKSSRLPKSWVPKQAPRKPDPLLLPQNHSVRSLLSLPVRRVLSEQKAQLWTVKYAPQSLKDICGNKTQVEKLKTWLEAW